MESNYQNGIVNARTLFNGHWLTHARRMCLDLMALPDCNREEALSLLAEVDVKLNDSGSLNLSNGHRPLAIVPNSGSIISTLQFEELEDEQLRREAFRQAVYYVGFETSSQCNRRCHYCPNSINDRISWNNFISDEAFMAAVSDLRAIDYDKEVHFVGFNEPLMHADNLCDRIATLRREVPKSHVAVFTNGDYLNSAILDQLVDAGMNDLVISVHLAAGKQYNDGDIFDRINKTAQQLGTPIIPKAYQQDASINVQLVHPRARIEVYQSDYMRLGSTRAGILKDIGPQQGGRTAACLRPMHQFVVGHKANVIPCCTMVSDDLSASKYTVGTLEGGTSIFDIYCGPSYIGWRKSMFSLEPKEAPCDTCTDFSWAGNLNDASIYAPLLDPAATEIKIIDFAMTVDRLFFI